MQAIIYPQPGDASLLRLVDNVPEPPLPADGVRIAVRATAVNRADILQRRGKYPPPLGASPLLGLECAGDVVEVGAEAGAWRVGQRVMALLSGGGYATVAVAHAGSVMAIPEGMSYEEAAALPEATLTAFSNVFEVGGAQGQDRILIQGGGSGVGTAAIALAQEANLTTYVTAGSPAKCERCRALGAAVAIDYRTQSFVDVVAQETQGRGVQVVLDCIGAPILNDHLQALALDGRLVLIGLMGGPTGSIDLSLVLRKRLRIIGSTLRSRSDAEKARLVRAFEERFGDALRRGRLRPTVDCVMPLAEAGTAHGRMEASSHFGKIVLRSPAIS